MNPLSIQLQTNRLRLNLTQRQLSEKSGVAYSTLRKLEGTGAGSVSDFVKLLKTLEMRAHLAVLGLARSAAPGDAPIVRRMRARKRSAVIAEPIQAPAASAPPKLSNGLKSERLGLSFPYDWSNPQIDDAVLIAKVLDKARFNDVSRTIAHFGLPRVEQIAERFGIAMDRGPLGAILPSIRFARVAHARFTA
jgi:transcriptional regulator with XRE-family HTH domain